MQHVAKEDVLYPEKAAVLGPIKVINQEQPGVICRSIDVTLPGHGVPGDHKKNLIRQLWAEFQVLPESSEPVAALRDNSRWVQTFEPVRLEEVHRDLLPLREKGVYLITGGMGELGLIFSRYLAEHYSARLILTGRSPFPAKSSRDQWLADHGEDDTTGKKIITLKEMEKCGAQVLVFQADAGDREQMQQVVRQAESNFGTVNGVIHAAGITGGETFRPVKDISRTQCQQQFRGKAYGLLILEDLLKDHQLDFCWVISSISAVLGGLSHVAYAAANTFMDAYINARSRGNNRHWISVNWDRMTPHENVEGFKRTLALGGTSQVVASSQENLRDRINRWIKLESFRDKEDSKKDDLSTLTLKPRPHFLKSYVPPGSPVEEALVRVCTDMFGFEKIGIHDDFFELGGDSLKAVIFAGKIHKETHVEVPITEIFHCRTLKRVADYIEANRGSRRFSSIENAEEKDYYVLSSAQKRMYILYLQDHASIAYNTPDAMKIRGPLVIDRFEKTILTMMKRYESLRTSFELIEGEPVQRIHEFDHVEFEIEYHRVGESPGSPGEQGISIGVDGIIQDFIRPFDLAKAPPLRVGLIELPQQEYMVLFDMHHIISDGISRNILERDFVNLYVGKEVPGLTIDYKDFSEWEERFFETPAFKRQEEFWQEYLKGKLPALQMPLDFSRPETQTFEGKGVPFTIPGEITEKLNILAKEVNVTPNILILSLYILLLHKYSDQDDIIVGSLVSGRNHADLENILGMFANFLPIRCKVEPDSPFSEFLNSTGKTILDAYENQDYPFEKTLELVNYPVDLTRNPMFDSMVIFHNQADGDSRLKIDNLEFTAYPLAKETSKLDFKIDVYPDIKGELNCILEYNTNLFKEDTIRDFIRHFHILINEVIENPPPGISHLDIFTKEEKLALSEKRSRSADSPRKPVRLVVSASFTSEPVKDYIVWWGKHFGLDIRVVFAPYNQVFQELLDEQSLVSTNGAGGINLLLIRFEDWIRDLHLSDREKCEKLESNFENLIKIFKNKQKTVPYFVGLFPPADYLSFSPVLMNYLEDMYGRWQTFLETIDNAYAVDFSPLKELYSVEEVFDAVADREGHLPFSSEFYAAVGTTIARKIWALAENPFKVIVLDCDNTLWKGICGEDGPLGVSVDPPHLELQRFMARKTNEGFLLALCSKNNEADVREVFEKNPGMLLEKEHFVGWKIDWQPKSENIKALARELNLGIDSFIFLDDSPMECAEVMSHCPDVLTLQLPENPAGIPLFLDHVWAFDKIKVTEEDRRRTKMYRAEKERKESEKDSLSLEDFLAHLQLKISMNLMEPTQVSRVSQLTRRTNQFNLSTIRRTEDEIMNLVKEPGTQCWVIEVSDRFGDYGLVGVIITKERKESLFIDTLLLSCRVLGRGVEEAILAGLRKYCRTRQLNMLEADYFPTAKNKPLLAFLQDRWTRQQDRGEYSTYIYPFEDRSESIEFVDFYYRETFKKELPREMETVETEDILQDHIAVAVTDMEKAVSFYRTLGYACGEVTHDPLQRSDLVICRKPGYDSIELVAATDSQSPTRQVINKNGDTPYHLCYRARDAAGLLELFRQKEIEFEIVDDLKPAVLFDHKKVMFLQVKHVGLVELLEDKEGDYKGNGNGREGGKNSTLRIVVGRPGPSLAFYKLLGYVPVKNINTPGKLEITLVKSGAGKIELVVPKEETLEEYLFLSKNGSHPYQLCFEYDEPPLENPVEYKYICYRKKAEQAPVSREYRAFKTGHADNIDKLLHKKQLLPLENVTAERLLGLPTYNVDEKIVTRAKYEPPRNKWERQLVEIFKEVLKVNKVSVHDNYFDIGAHSWDIIKINSRLQKTFEKEITVAEMFRYPTISSLAVYFRDGETRGFPSDEKIDESVSIMEEAADTLFKDEIE
jgi:FkbH-like protein